MGRFDGKVVFITGAARGQGRSHAVRFASEGADIIATDLCADVAGAEYPMAGEADLEMTAKLARDAGGKVVSAIADVRKQGELDDAVALGIEAFGRLDVVCANAGIFTWAENSWSLTEDQWASTIDIDLNGVWRTCKTAVPHMIAAGNGGSIIITASSNGYRAEEGHAAYNAAKIGLVGFMRALAGELGRHRIRVNTIHPMTVKTDMMWNDQMVGLFHPGKIRADVDEEAYWQGMTDMNLLPVGAIDATTITDVVMFLASEEGRYITACEVPVDGGYIMKT